MTGYHDRVAGIRAALARLDPATVTAAVGPAMVDQVKAASTEAQTMLRRIGTTEHDVNPQRFPDPTIRTSDDRAALDDITARVLAAMGEGNWRQCPHLRRTPAQPAQVRLPLRRVDCQRCAATWRTPPPHEDDRCDLCGSRGNESFWPIRFTITSWLVLGDMCRDCAHHILPTVGATP